MNVAAFARKHARLFGNNTWRPLLGGLILVLACVSGAHAYWTSAGLGSGTGGAGTLLAPTASATPGAGTVALSWSAVTPPGTGAVAYYVTRGGDAGGDCPTSAAPTSVLACTDSGLSAGTYGYTVTAVWRSWTALSSPHTQVTLASGALDHFVLSAATTTPTAGQVNNLTITAKDAASNTVTAYTGSRNVTFSGASSIGAFTPTVTSSSGAATNLGTATAISFVNGVASASGSSNGVMQLYKAETASIIVSDGTGHGNGAGLAITVNPAAAASLVVTGYPSPTTAGVSHTFTVTAKDAFNNTAPGYAGTVHFTSSDGAAVLPANAPLASGTATFSATLKTAGSQSISATDTVTGSITGSQAAITVNPAAAAKLVFTQSPGNTAAGVPFASQPQVTIQDQYGNTVTTDSSSVTIAVTGGTAGIGCAANPKAASSGVATFSGCWIAKAGTYTLTAMDGSLTAAVSGSFTISGGFLKVQHRNYDAAAPSDNQVKPGLQLVNTGGSSVALSTVTIRYWFTRDAGASTFGTWCDYAAIDCANLTEQVIAVSPTRTGADSYLLVSYTSGAGSLAAGASTSDAQLRFNKTDWSNFDETNDYSYDTNTSYVDSTTVTVYVSGVLVWGTEP